MKNNWHIIVEVESGEIDAALSALAENMGFEENVFENMNTESLEDAEYVTAVPVELALTSDMREKLLENNKDLNYIVTRVQKDRVKHMVEDLDYKLIPVEDYLEEEEYDEDDEPVEIVDKDTFYQVGSKTVKGNVIYDALDEDPVHPKDEDRENAVFTINGKKVPESVFYTKMDEVVHDVLKYFNDIF